MQPAYSSASKTQLRTIGEALDLYFIDHGSFPPPSVSMPGDPFGVVAATSLHRLTTPIAYVNPRAFRDPFGTIRLQYPSMVAQSALDDPLAPPLPGFNTGQSLLYFSYPHLAWLVGDGDLAREGYSAISVGPDRVDSFIVYYPFPASLPRRSALYGVGSVLDAIYDPTNGLVSSGDLATFGGDVPAPRLLGGSEY